MIRESKKPVSLSISVPVLKKVARESKRRGESKSAVVTDILRSYFENRSRKTKS